MAAILDFLLLRKMLKDGREPTLISFWGSLPSIISWEKNLYQPLLGTGKIVGFAAVLDELEHDFGV